MTIDVATGIVRILKQEGVAWVSTFPVCRVNNALGREGVPMLMMRDDRYAVAVAEAFSRITAGSRIGVCTFQGGVNAAGMQYAYAGMTHAYEDGSPVLCITDGVPAGSLGCHGHIRRDRRSLPSREGWKSAPDPADVRAADDPAPGSP
jgi:thiamine pyrophosphate-dependent acetolactate synthase large subunit-like protein